MSTTHSRNLSHLFHLLVVLAASITAIGGIAVIAGCGDDGDASTDAAGALRWYETCGDPVCGGYMPSGDPVCMTEAAGQPCAQADTRCELANNDCNADLLCTASDPTTNCPISQKRHKRDIHYLSAEERRAVAEDLLDTKLATYRYIQEPAASPRLGFLIDDNRESPAVLPSGERVDVYGYTSMAVAALQTQAEEIAALKAELGALSAEVKALREGASSCSP